MKPAKRTRIIFITGTDTGIGKTVLTSLLIAHLRQAGCRALALKPFCSGSRQDAEILFQLQEGQLTMDDINPWFFPEPLAPLVAARLHRKRITLRSVVTHIRRFASRLAAVAVENSRKAVLLRGEPVLLIEGAGGLMVPLGERFTTLELIQSLRCQVLVVAPNRLGTINHTLLTLKALKPFGLSARVVLMGTQKPDPSAETNAQVLAEWVGRNLVFRLPFLGSNCGVGEQIIAHAQRLKPELRRIMS